MGKRAWHIVLATLLVVCLSLCACSGGGSGPSGSGTPSSGAPSSSSSGSQGSGSGSNGGSGSGSSGGSQSGSTDPGGSGGSGTQPSGGSQGGNGGSGSGSGEQTESPAPASDPASAAANGGTTSGGAYKMPKKAASYSFDAGAAEEDNGAAIDLSNAGKGVVSASATADSRLKLQVIKDEMSYNYDVPQDGTPITVPLNMGDGSYTVRVMQNTSGKNYVEVFGVTQDISLDSEFAPFLVPNMFVQYSDGDSVVSKARELAQGAANEGDVASAIYAWIVDNVTYDFDKAKELADATGYVPSPAETLSVKSGICFDYASLAAAMLRSLGIPTKVITGYVDPDGVYHAWNMIYIDGTWVTAEINVPANTWSRIDTTFAATSNAAGNTADKSYTDRYTY